MARPPLGGTSRPAARLTQAGAAPPIKRDLRVAGEGARRGGAPEGRGPGRGLLARLNGGTGAASRTPGGGRGPPPAGVGGNGSLPPGRTSGSTTGSSKVAVMPRPPQPQPARTLRSGGGKRRKATFSTATCPRSVGRRAPSGLFSEQAGGADEEHADEDDQDGEAGRALDLGEIGLRHVLHDAHDQAAEERPRHRRHPPENRRGEGEDEDVG